MSLPSSPNNLEQTYGFPKDLLPNLSKNPLYNHLLYSIGNALQNNNPIGALSYDYKENRNGFFANTVFKVFEPFQAEKRQIDPKITLDLFFEDGKNIQDMIAQRLRAPAFEDQGQHLAWAGQFRTLLAKQGPRVYDASLWAVHLSNRNSIVGKKVREKLSGLGFADPKKLPPVVLNLFDGVLNLYDVIEYLHLQNWNSVLIKE